MTHGYDDCVHTLLGTLNKVEYQSQRTEETIDDTINIIKTRILIM